MPMSKISSIFKEWVCKKKAKIISARQSACYRLCLAISLRTIKPLLPSQKLSLAHLIKVPWKVLWNSLIELWVLVTHLKTNHSRMLCRQFLVQWECKKFARFIESESKGISARASFKIITIYGFFIALKNMKERSNIPLSANIFTLFQVN